MDLEKEGRSYPVAFLLAVSIIILATYSSIPSSPASDIESD